MKYVILEVTIDKKEQVKHYTWNSVEQANTTEEKILLVKKEIAYLEDEIKSLQSVNKLLARRRAELDNFKALLKLLEAKND